MISNKISLALVTYNQAELLIPFLERYQQFGAEIISLILVDDGSTDNTQDVIRKFSLKIDTQLIPHGGAAKARNAALKRCRTPWIAFTDTDCLLDAAYFLKLVTIPDQFPNATAVEGAVITPDKNIPPLTHWLENPHGGNYATANMVFRIEALQTLAGFDERFPANLREDSDLALRILDKYGPIPFCKELVVIHPFIRRGFFKSLVQAWPKQRQVMQAECLLYEKHQHSYQRIRRLSSAELTLQRWRLRYFFLYAKSAWPWVREQAQLGPLHFISAFGRYLQALIVALWEQLCINLHWHLGFK